MLWAGGESAERRLGSTSSGPGNTVEPSPCPAHANARWQESIHVATVAPALQQCFHRLITERFTQHLVHAFGHALQRTAHVDDGTTLHPVAQGIGRHAQAILYVAAVAIARERQVHPRKMTVGLPGLDLVGEQEIVRTLAFTKQQSVPVFSRMGGFAQQAAQAGDAGAVADQYHGCTGHAMETRIAVHAGGDAGAYRRMH